MLHTVNKSAFSSSLLRDCLRIVGAGDAVLLLNDGLYGAVPASPVAAEMERLCGEGCLFYGLGKDAEQRELTGRLLPCLQLIDFREFVELAASHRQTQSWY